MTQDEIIEMARKSDFEIHSDNLISFDGIDCTSELIAFAKLVAEREREECAKLMDEMAVKDNLTNYYKVASNAIRAREQE